MASTAPAGLVELAPAETADTKESLYLADWEYKRGRAIREYTELPPPLLTGLFSTLSDGGDCADDEITKSSFMYPLLPIHRGKG